jgi:type II secretory pathway component GspD/PulD (secretin)
MMLSKRFWMTALAIGLAVASAAAAEPADAPEPSDGMVALNFPEDLDLKVLIDYVGNRPSVNFIYDEQIGGRKVTIKAPTKIPAASLMTLLESALKMKGLAVVPTEVPGMMRVEVTKQLSAISVGPKAAAELPMDARPTLAVTRVFELKHASPQRVETVVKPFLSSTSANLSALADHDMVVVTDYAGNMQRIEEMVTLVDRLIHRAEIVSIEGGSYRFKEAKERAARKKRGTNGTKPSTKTRRK